MSDLIKREDAIETIHNYWKKRLDTLPTADIQQMDKIFEHNKTLCNFINAIPSADRLQGKWIRTAEEYIGDDVSGFYDYHWACSECEKEAIINEWNIYELSDYCPHCGAKMKGTDDE